MAFVGNTTSGVSTILKSLDLEPEDVLLCTSHIYSAVLNAADAVVTKANADLVSDVEKTFYVYNLRLVNDSA